MRGNSAAKARADDDKIEIEYGSPVLRIEQDSKHVRAIAVQSGMGLTFETDRLICAVPFPCTKKSRSGAAIFRAKAESDCRAKI